MHLFKVHHAQTLLCSIGQNMLLRAVLVLYVEVTYDGKSLTDKTSIKPYENNV